MRLILIAALTSLSFIGCGGGASMWAPSSVRDSGDAVVVTDPASSATIIAPPATPLSQSATPTVASGSDNGVVEAAAATPTSANYTINITQNFYGLLRSPTRATHVSAHGYRLLDRNGKFVSCRHLDGCGPDVESATLVRLI